VHLPHASGGCIHPDPAVRVAPEVQACAAGRSEDASISPGGGDAVTYRVITCEHCGKEARIFRSPSAACEPRFCNRACSTAWRRVIREEDVARFWSNVDKTGTCWVWTGARNVRRMGYGATSLGGKNTPAHRASWRLTNGEIPSGMFVCHRCDNPPCVRPDHLFLGTHGENMRDMMSKNRYAKHRDLPRGEAHPGAVWTEAMVRAARERVRAGERHADVAKDMGVSKSVVTAAVARKTWRHVA
jgi:hypothetical protein